MGDSNGLLLTALFAGPGREEAHPAVFLRPRAYVPESQTLHLKSFASLARPNSLGRFTFDSSAVHGYRLNGTFFEVVLRTRIISGVGNTFSSIWLAPAFGRSCTSEPKARRQDLTSRWHSGTTPRRTLGSHYSGNKSVR